MRRILIDQEVKERVEEYVGVMTMNQPQKVNWKMDEMPRERLLAFFHFLWGHHHYDEGRYVYAILFLYNELLALKPEYFNIVYESFFKQWDRVLNVIIDYDGNKKEFYKHVLNCMRYKDIRSGLMRQYMKDQKIKACVYCNAQYAVTTEEFVEKEIKKRIGTYQFDHFKAESLYPFLCTSYYNLQPSCPACNNSKALNDSFFNLYTTKAEDQDVFWFELTPDKVIEDYLEKDMGVLEVKLNSEDKNLLKNHQDRFHIDMIYEQHLDVVEELIVKMRAFSKCNQTATEESLAELFPNGVEDPERFFFGYYMDKEHVHSRPLSKLAQDVVGMFK